MDNVGITPLQYAITQGFQPAMKALLAAGSDVSASAQTTLSPFMQALWENQEEVVKLLVIEGKADLNEKDRYHEGNCFHYAAKNNNVNLINFFFHKGAALFDSQDHNGHTPLFIAVERNLLEATRALLDHKVDVNIPDPAGNTPLHVAVELDNLDIVKHLVREKANLNYRNEAGYTPFHMALALNQHKTAFYLIAHDADPNVPTFEGVYPIHTAIQEGSFKWVSVLVESGADFNVADGNGATPFDYAVAFKRPQAIEFLRSKKALKGTGMVSVPNRDEK